MRWRKMGVVASTEFNNAVRTKAFLVSLLMLPLIYGAAFLIQIYANKADTRTRRFRGCRSDGRALRADRAAGEGPQ